MAQAPTYEEQFGPVERRLRRVRRRASWAKKTALGLAREILIEIKWRLGDEIMAIPIYKALHRAHPDARITVLCNYPELLEGNPHVWAVNVYPEYPDRYILLRHARRDRPRLRNYADTAMIAPPTSCPRLYLRDWNCAQLAQLPHESRLVAVSAGASWQTKRWPQDRWRVLCSGLEVAGCGIVELGAEGDCSIGEGISLVGQTSIRDAACVLRQAQLFIGSDSGLMHLALAVGTPVLALFGPTDPSFLVHGDQDFETINNGRDCAGCWNLSQAMIEPGVCPLNIADCMATIDSHAVLARARAMLGLES